VVSTRACESGDHGAIFKLVAAAFGRADEARIIDRLRLDGAVLVELVALEAGEIVGCLMFSRMVVRPERFIAGLGPLAVSPPLQRAGIGSALCRAGVEAIRALGAQAIVVLGHPTYYSRFGFSTDAAARLRSPYSGRPAFMALALRPGVLDTPLQLDYPPAFG